MLHYCIFQISKLSKRFEFLFDFGEDYSAADDMCQSLNNFRSSDTPIYFCIRCLGQGEFEHIEYYYPFMTGLVI